MAQIEEPENFYVHIPSVQATDTSEGSFKNVATFHSYAEAVAFTTAAFGSDDEGKVDLISGGSMPDKSYRVTWEIDIDAASPREAAEKALHIQRDPDSIATVFTVAQKRHLLQIDVRPDTSIALE